MSCSHNQTDAPSKRIQPQPNLYENQIKDGSESECDRNKQQQKMQLCMSNLSLLSDPLGPCTNSNIAGTNIGESEKDKKEPHQVQQSVTWDDIPNLVTLSKCKINNASSIAVQAEIDSIAVTFDYSTQTKSYNFVFSNHFGHHQGKPHSDGENDASPGTDDDQHNKSKIRHTMLSLAGLTHFYSSSPEAACKLPISRFQFHGGHLNSPDLTDFITSHGSKVHTLSLCFQCAKDNVVEDELTLPQYLHLLQNLTSAEQFDLDIPASWFKCNVSIAKHDLDDLPSISLPRLKRVHFGAGPSSSFNTIPKNKVITTFVRKIMEAAVNLEDVKNGHPAVLEIVGSAGKLSSVKELDFSPSDDPVDLFFQANYLPFADLRPQLQRLNIGYEALLLQKTQQGQERAGKKTGTGKMKLTENEVAINKILLSSRDSLEELWIHPLARLKNLELPRLTNLKNLYLCFLPTDGDQDWKITLREHDLSHHLNLTHVLNFSFKSWQDSDQVFFPRGLALVDMASVFPNLTSVTLDLHTQDSKYASLHFPQRPSFNSVRELNVTRCCSATWIQKLALIFPSLDQLSIDIDTSDTETNRLLWTLWPHLKSIQLQRVQWDHASNSPVLDSIFTGMTEASCQRLRDSLPASGSHSQVKVKHLSVEKLRKKPSICLLRDLKELRMRLLNQPNSACHHDCHEHKSKCIGKKSSESKYRLISPVSALYAFNLLPLLKVTIQFRPLGSSQLAEDLKSIDPYVDLEELEE